MRAEPLNIGLPDGATVSGLLVAPPGACALYVLAHGAGAGMNHAFMEHLAAALARCRVATLRYNFPFMEASAGKRLARADRPEVAHAAVRAACARAQELAPDLPMFAGGKSFGARMTSQAQALAPIAHVRGLVFVGFPLHPARKPAVTRADHLTAVRTPMLFIQGTRDALADLTLMRDVCANLPTATLHVVEDADHGFATRARSERSHASVMEEIADAIRAWIDAELAN